MIKIFNTELINCCICSSILNNNCIYILYNKNVKSVSKFYIPNYEHVSELHLLKINLITKNIEDKHITTDIFNNIYHSAIVNNLIYLHDNTNTYIYDLDLNLSKKFDFVSYTIFNINDDIYFLKKDVDCFNVVNENNNIILKIQFDCVVNSIDDTKDIIMLKLECDIYIEFFTYEDYIIFYQGTIIAYNIKTKNLVQLYDTYYSYINNSLYINSNNNNNIVSVYDFSTLKNNLLSDDLLSLYNISNEYVDLGSNYYLIYNNRDIIIYYRYIIDNINIDKYIYIGTKENKINISLNLLLNNSQYIMELFQNFKNEYNFKETENLIHDSFENINIYQKFLNCQFTKNDYSELIKLLKICDFLQDKNIIILENMIIDHIYYCDINKAFEYLEFLFIHNYNYLSIFYTILKQYKYNELKLKLKNLTNKKLYNFCIDECIKYSSIS